MKLLLTKTNRPWIVEEKKGLLLFAVLTQSLIDRIQFLSEISGLTIKIVKKSGNF
jgi:hypothetical protein